MASAVLADMGRAGNPRAAVLGGDGSRRLLSAKTAVSAVPAVLSLPGPVSPPGRVPGKRPELQAMQFSLVPGPQGHKSKACGRCHPLRQLSSDTREVIH